MQHLSSGALKLDISPQHCCSLFLRVSDQRFFSRAPSYAPIILGSGPSPAASREPTVCQPTGSFSPEPRTPHPIDLNLTREFYKGSKGGGRMSASILFPSSAFSQHFSCCWRLILSFAVQKGPGTIPTPKGDPGCPVTGRIFRGWPWVSGVISSHNSCQHISFTCFPPFLYQSQRKTVAFIFS